MTWCVPAGVGGSEEYLCRQLLGLSPDDFAVTIYAPQGFGQSHLDLQNIHRIVELPHRSSSRARRVISESTWLYRRTSDSAIVHHGGGTIPLRYRRPTLLTIHDLQYVDFPGYVRRHKLLYLRSIMPRSAHRADLIAVPTQFVKETVERAYDISPDKIVVVPHGVEPSLGRESTSEQELRQKFQLGDRPIVVMPAMTHPHKGHHFILDVMETSWGNQGVRLVLIGGAGGAEKTVLRRVSNAPLRSSVSKLGRVSNADRDGLLKMAYALVFPSEFEGFGAPVIEAMVLGVPVITSDQACLPEVVGDAGMVLPLNVEVWSMALSTLDKHREELVRKGLQRAQLFTSAASGTALACAYRRLL